MKFCNSSNYPSFEGTSKQIVSEAMLQMTGEAGLLLQQQEDLKLPYTILRVV